MPDGGVCAVHKVWHFHGMQQPTPAVTHTTGRAVIGDLNPGTVHRGSWASSCGRLKQFDHP